VRYPGVEVGDGLEPSEHAGELRLAKRIAYSGPSEGEAVEDRQ